MAASVDRWATNPQFALDWGHELGQGAPSHPSTMRVLLGISIVRRSGERAAIRPYVPGKKAAKQEGETLRVDVDVARASAKR